MYDKEELCNKITNLYPDIGECGIDITVDFEEAKNAWVIELHKDNHHLKHYLDLPEARQCMEGEQCVALGLDIAQLKKNIRHEQF
jgi:hypothetical protein